MDENGWKLMEIGGNGWKWMKIDESGWKYMFFSWNVVIILKCGQDSEVCSTLNSCKYIAIFLDVALHWTVVYI